MLYQNSDKQLAAKLSRQLYAKEITFNKFVDDFPMDSNNSDIDQLFDLIEHEPKCGGFLGVSKMRHDLYIADIFKLIEKLEKQHCPSDADSCQE